MKDKILSIQSKLVYGYVGSNIAELAIQLHGLDIIAFPTVLLSAHTGHQPSHGMRMGKDLFEDLIAGIDALDILDSTANIITGYIGSEDVLLSTAHYIKKIKSKYADKLYICDPVMGDDGGLYVNENLAKTLIDNLIPLCDVMTPNHFEFEYIAGRKARTIDEILEAVANHSVLREKIVVVTSCNLGDTPADIIETIIVEGGVAYRIEAKRIDIDTTGTGDLFTASTASQLALGKDVKQAVTEATQIVKRALDLTVELGNEEMNARCLVKSIVR